MTRDADDRLERHFRAAQRGVGDVERCTVDSWNTQAMLTWYRLYCHQVPSPFFSSSTEL